MSEPLQRLADTLCRAFCGWKLQHDRSTLFRLGSGKLDIDLLKKTCRFEHDYIPRLVIVDELIRQLRPFLENDGVVTERMRSAALEIMFTIEEREDQKDRSVMWFGEHAGFVGCEMEVLCTITTEDESCKSEHRGYVEWPREASVRS